MPFRSVLSEMTIAARLTSPFRATLMICGVCACLWAVGSTGVQPKRAAPIIPDSLTLRLSSMGQELGLADWYWLKAVQYYGDATNAAIGYRHLSSYLSLVTDLDPRFAYAYRFAGVTIPYPSRNGWLFVDRAESLLSKGLDHCPATWQIGMLLGFTRLWYLNDTKGAAEAFEQSSQAPGCPSFVPLLATRLRAETGAPELGLKLANELLAETEEPELREELQLRVAQLTVEANLQKIERALAQFSHARGALPGRLEELVEAGLLDSLPTFPFEYTPSTGAVTTPELPRRLRRLEAIADIDKDQRRIAPSPSNFIP